MKITLESFGDEEPLVVDLYETQEDLGITRSGQQFWIRGTDILRLAALIATQRELNKPQPIVVSPAPYFGPPNPRRQYI